MGIASIDIVALDSTITACETAVLQVTTDRDGLRQWLGYVELPTSCLTPVDGVIAGLTARLPDLHRRIALARSIVASTPGAGLVVNVDESMLCDLTPEQAQAEGARIAADLRENPQDVS